MDDGSFALVLMTATIAGLYVHGTVVLRRIVAEVQRGRGGPPPTILSPLGHGDAIAAYRDLADADDGGPSLPRLHRSIWLTRTLLGLMLLAMVVRVVLDVVS